MKPKVLFILHIPPPIHGSAIVGQYIKDSVVIQDVFDCQFVNLSTSVKLDEIGKKGIRKLFRFLSIFWQIFTYLINWRPDLCYIAITIKGSAFYKDSIVVALVKLFGTKLVYHFHNKGVSTRQNKFIDNQLYQFTFHRAHVILTSKYLYPDIQKYIPEECVSYCPNGILENIPVVQQITDNEQPDILFLSNMIESKGVFILLDACKILKDKGLDFHCTFVGGWGNITEAQFYAKVQEADINQIVTYKGKKFGVEKEIVFTQANIFVHPTFNDCFPLVLLEAMQHYLPVVSTTEGGIPDIVEDGITGFLVSPLNAVNLSQKLEILIKDKSLCQKMGNSARAEYEKKFTMEIFENNFKKILNKIANQSLIR